MKQKSIGFRDLLERLLPVDELPPVERLRVQRALRSGVALEVERTAMHAIELLEQQGALRRLPADDANGGMPVVRYQARDQIDVIALHLPGPLKRDGITIVPRAGLPTQAPARLDQVRRLIRLDDPMIFADPRSGTTRAGLLAQLDQAGRELLGAAVVRFFGRDDEEHDARGDAPADRKLATEVMAHHEMLFYCPDTDRGGSMTAFSQLGVRSIVFAAVMGSDGEPLGHLEVHSPELDPFRPADLAMVALLADFCGGVIERATRIEKLVFVDPLTSAYNRSYYDLQIRNEMARAQREQSTLALVIADIDDFKSFNTSFGYEAGNQVLLQVAQALRTGVRPFDTVARWGGEEFAIVLTPPVNEEDVLAISERLRAAVERTAIRLEGLDGRAHRANVTISMGIALCPEHADNPQDLWRLANQALLKAKRLPKNQVVFYRPKADPKLGTA